MADAPRMRILLVGAGGTIGRAVAAELAQRHDIVTAGRSAGDVRIDLTDPASVVSAIAQAGPVDAVACAAGGVAFKPLAAIEPASVTASVYGVGLADKLMGQVNLALAARETLRDGGSITLVSGVLSEVPILYGSSASMVNAALEAFVRAAAIDLPRGLRINVVSPAVVTESMANFGPFFRGFESVPVARVALAYSRSIEGRQTGQTFQVV